MFAGKRILIRKYPVYFAQPVVSIVLLDNARHKHNISKTESIAFGIKMRLLLGSTHLIHCTAVVVAAAHGVEALCIDKNNLQRAASALTG